VRIPFSEIFQGCAYHPRDKDFGTGCDGWRKATDLFPDLEKYRRPDHEEQGDTYSSIPEKYGVETVPATVFEAITIADVELSFVLLAQQAERGIDTRRCENHIAECKKTLQLLAEHTEGEVVEANPVPFDEGTPLRVLLSCPRGCRHSLAGLPAYPLDYRGKEFSLLSLPTIPNVPQIRCAWTGKEIVALHLDNLQPICCPKCGHWIDHTETILCHLERKAVCLKCGHKWMV